MADAISGFQKQEIITAAIFPIGYTSANYTTAGDLQNQLNEIYDEAIIDISHSLDWRFLHSSYTWSQSSGNTYDLSSHSVYPLHIESLFITTLGKGKRVFKSDWKTFLRQDPSGINTGDPTLYDRWSDSVIIFDRSIQSTCDFNLLYKRIIPMQESAASYPIIPRQYQRNIRNYVRWKVAEDKGDRRASQFAEVYFATLEKDKIIEQAVLDSGDQRIVQPDEYDASGGYQPTSRDVYNRWHG